MTTLFVLCFKLLLFIPDKVFRIIIAEMIKCQDIRYRHGIQYTVQTEEHWQKQGEAHAEYHLTEHGQERGSRVPYLLLQEDEACLVDAGEDIIQR